MPTIINPLPNTLTNGTTADANQVMANFDQIVEDVNANAAGTGTNSDITELTGLTTPLSVPQGGTGTTYATQYTEATPSNPTAVTSSSLKMMGFKQQITPQKDGNILALFFGNGHYAANVGGVSYVWTLYYGTGSPPNNGASPPAGATQIGSEITIDTSDVATDDLNLALGALVPGLTVGTEYWFDVAMRTTGTSIAFNNPSIILLEV